MRKAILAILLLAAAGYAAFYAIAIFHAGVRTPDKIIRIRDVDFEVEVPQGAAAMERGLGYRASLPDGRGMLFIFPSVGNYPFWMKGMEFPIDIIWINGDEVAGTTENMQPQPGASDAELRIYYPPAYANEVLEVPAGTVEKYGFKVGDSATLLTGN